MYEEAEKAAEIVLKGGVIIYPTDTIWGIGCDASNAEAVTKVFNLKKRSDSKSLIALVANQTQLMRVVRDIPSLAFDLMECATRPMTIIYDKVSGIAENAMAQDGSMGIRVVNDDFCRVLINKIKRPLISTSANISGVASPSFYKEISQEILCGADYVVDWRRDETAKKTASTIIKLTNDAKITIIRK